MEIYSSSILKEAHAKTQTDRYNQNFSVLTQYKNMKKHSIYLICLNTFLNLIYSELNFFF